MEGLEGNMFGIDKFHDESYDGIVLNIPSWFIEMNSIESALTSLYNELEACNKSMFHPDHLSNLYELKEYKSKSYKLGLKKLKEQIEKENREQHYQNILSGEIKPLKWCKVTEQSKDSIQIGGEYYSPDSFITNRLNVKTELLKLIFSNVKTFEDFKDFASVNFPYIFQVSCKNTNEELIDWQNMWFSIGYAATLQININVLNVAIHVTAAKNKSYTYRKTHLKFINGNYGIEKGNDIIEFDGFKRKGLELIKQHK